MNASNSQLACEIGVIPEVWIKPQSWRKKPTCTRSLAAMEASGEFQDDGSRN